MSDAKCRNFKLEIAGLQQLVNSQAKEIDSLRTQLAAAEARLATAHALLREAVKSWDDSRQDETSFLLGSQWYERAKKEVGDGE